MIGKYALLGFCIAESVFASQQDDCFGIGNCPYRPAGNAFPSRNCFV